MSTNVVKFNPARLNLLLICDEMLPKSRVTRELRRRGVAVRCVNHSDAALDELDRSEPDAVWMVASGDNAFSLGTLARLFEVEHITSPWHTGVFWVGPDTPRGLSLVTKTFAAMPPPEEIIRESQCIPSNKSAAHPSHSLAGNS